MMSVPIINRQVCKLLVLILCSLPGVYVGAQLREPFLQHITVEQGLSQSSVYCVLQDRQGFLWFGTGDGLNKFDGYEMTVYRHHESDTNSLADNTIRAFMEDRSGILWIATAEALNKYDKVTGKYIRLPVTWTESLLQNKIGRIWIGTDGGLQYCDSSRDSVHRYRYPVGYKTWGEHLAIKSLFEDSEGNLWVGNNEDVDKIDRTTGAITCFSKAFFQDGVPALVYSIVEDKNKAIWVSTWGKGLFKISLDSGVIKHFVTDPKRPHSISDNFISTMYLYNDTTILLGTQSNGVVGFQMQKEICSPFLDKQIQPGFFISKNARSIFCDKSGILWIGTDGDGIYKFDSRPNKFAHIFVHEGSTNTLSGNFLRSVYEDSRGRVWLGTYEHGLTMWDKATNTFKQYLLNGSEIQKENKGHSVFSICEDSSGVLWFGTEYGLVQFDERHQRWIFFEPRKIYSSKDVPSIWLSRSKKLWVSYGYILYSFDPQTGVFENMLFDSDHYPDLHNVGITTTYEDSKGILWLGSYSGGLNRLDIRNHQFTTYIYDKKNENSISSNMIKVVTESSDGNIWIGTDHGLNKFDPRTSTFTRYFEENGLPNAYIYGILENRNNNLWISTNKGISCFTPSNQKFRNYGIEDGLQSSEFNTGAYFKSRTGTMYFGGINGLNMFHPDSVKDNSNIPQIVITGFKTLDLPIEHKGELSELTEVTLNYEDDIFSLRFAALEYTNPEKNQYAYMLEGFEENWIYSGTRREVRYTHLDPGSYVFHVKGSNNDGVWNNEGISLHIVVVPPFWRTWWFLSATVIIILVSFGGTIRYFEMRKVRARFKEVERERAMERERARISQDMHDEIGANITKIAITSEIARRDLTNHVAMEKHLQKISENARDVVDSISEIIWAINPKHDRVDNLISFIREYASEFLEGTEMNCHFSIPEIIPDSPLSGEHRRNILMVVKEALTNIAKHAHATEVDILFTITKDLLTLTITDNGSGFSMESTSGSGNGLINMKKRMESINGTWNIQSEKNSGTTITVTLKLR